MLYGKETLILEEVTSTLLSNKIRKRPNQEEQTGGLVVTGRKGREGKKCPGSSKACHFCHRKDYWKNDCKHQQEYLKKMGQAAKADVALSGVEDTEILMASYKDNTSQDKGWIYDSGITIHVCSNKEMFNCLVVKEEGTIKIVDGSACKVIGTGRVKVTERDGTVLLAQRPSTLVVMMINSCSYSLLIIL